VQKFSPAEKEILLAVMYLVMLERTFGREGGYSDRDNPANSFLPTRFFEQGIHLHLYGQAGTEKSELLKMLVDGCLL